MLSRIQRTHIIFPNNVSKENIILVHSGIKFERTAAAVCFQEYNVRITGGRHYSRVDQTFMFCAWIQIITKLVVTNH